MYVMRREYMPCARRTQGGNLQVNFNIEKYVTNIDLVIIVRVYKFMKVNRTDSFTLESTLMMLFNFKLVRPSYPEARLIWRSGRQLGDIFPLLGAVVIDHMSCYMREPSPYIAIRILCAEN